MTVSKLVYALCSITQTDGTSYNREKRDCGLLLLIIPPGRAVKYCD